MEITLAQVGKQYPSGWVFKDINHTFTSNSITGIRGKNGSGKSTLLKIISSSLTPNEGELFHKKDGAVIKREEIPTKVYHIAPDIQMIDQLSIQETLNYHFSFRSIVPNKSIDQLLDFIWLKDFKNKKLNALSSGMRQRLQLGLAFFTDSDLILLDEPTANLDQDGIELFHQLVDGYSLNRTIVIASNEQRDFKHCENIIDILQWK